MWKCEESLSEAGVKPAGAVKMLSSRYEAYVHAYHENPSTCGREKLLVSQAASYLHGLVSAKIQGVVLTLLFESGKKVVIPASHFYE